MLPYRCVYNIFPVCRLRKKVFNTLDNVSVKEGGGTTVMCIGPFVPFDKMVIRVESFDILIELVSGPEAGRCGLRKSDGEIFIDSRPGDFACDQPVSKFKVVKCMERTPGVRQ